ncbi:MAG: hypothetical protein VX957_04860 [Candidatus Neomarinimicrobiota bacterium]|nr:hypothetical protein [Candidatus Neomarinimicrobiota bacterium]
MMVHLFKALKVVKGQSLAEFAVVTAMMATFITTALPKFSDLMDTGKAQTSIQELDKLLLQAKNFYETTAALEGRGRLPGQDKFDMKVGGYTDTTALFNDLQLFTTYTDETIGPKWISVFGTENVNALAPAGSHFKDDTLASETNNSGEVVCSNCPPAREKGADEWYDLFAEEVLVSSFQDGHYIYVVIPGTGTGDDVKAPRICVADGESPKYLHKIMDL